MPSPPRTGIQLPFVRAFVVAQILERYVPHCVYRTRSLSEEERIDSKIGGGVTVVTVRGSDSISNENTVGSWEVCRLNRSGVRGAFKGTARMQQQSGPGNGNARRALSPGPGGSDSEDSDISLGGTSPPSPSSSPPPTHQPSPVPLGPLGPLPPPSLNFRFDPTQSQFRFGHATAFKFPPAGFRFGPHSPQHNHPNIAGGGIFRLAESSPFQAVGPRGDLGSRLPDPLGLPPPRLHPHDGLLHHPHPQHPLPEGISRISEGSRLSDGLSEAHSPPLMATNLSVTGPLRVAVPSPHTPSSRGSPSSNQQTPQGQAQGQGLIRVATPPPNPKPPQIHRPFSPA
ncbi:homeobox protein SIX6 isoform X2 [Vespula maculifrons]|uniref:Uncharacterized protein n=2 Tax=Vespula TaxID=7451 RepID=A0A834U4X9_VESPE|nr:hypothetical protein H0235_011246 [Vespula pensylvanica]